MSREKREKTRVIQPHTVRRLLKYLMHYRWMFALALVLAVASNVFALVGPMLSGAAVDAIEPGKGRVDFAAVGHYCTLMALFYVASAALTYANSVLMIRLADAGKTKGDADEQD